MKFKFLGTADTGGIPRHNCYCEICEEARKNGVNNRSTSAYLELDDGSVILFDAGYDNLSEKFNTTKIRAVFLTHFHSDHCLGLIRLRKSADKICCYIPDDAKGFDDLFKHKGALEYTVLEPFEKVIIDGAEIIAVPLTHSKPTYGFILTCKDVAAYLTDCASIPEFSLSFLKSQQIDHLFLDACYEPNYKSDKHLNWENATEAIDKILPKNGYLIHASCKTLLPLKKSGKSLKYPYIPNGFSVEI